MDFQIHAAPPKIAAKVDPAMVDGFIGASPVDRKINIGVVLGGAADGNDVAFAGVPGIYVNGIRRGDLARDAWRCRQRVRRRAEHLPEHDDQAYAENSEYGG